MILKYPIVAGNGAEQTRGMLNGHIHREESPRRLMQKFLGAVGSLGSGMALGHEGPSIQFGGYLGVMIARLCRITRGREEYLISAGASAGVASALNAPLAGPVYIIESLQKINNFRTSICALLSGLTGGLIAAVLMPENPYLKIPLISPFMPNLSLLGILMLMSTYMTFIGIIFTQLVKFFRKHFNNKHSTLIQLSVFVVIMGIIGLYIPEILGSGQSFMIKMALSETQQIPLLTGITLLCIVFTAYSQGTSFPGGAFLPLLTLGGISGRLFGALMIIAGITQPENLAYFMFLGMSAAFVIVMRTPLTGFLLVTEMTGRFEILLPSLAVGVSGYFLISIFKMKSLEEDLYEMLLKRLKNSQEKELIIYTEVMPSSYFEGKTTNSIHLPLGCEIIRIIRNNISIDFKTDTKLIAGDQLEFSVIAGEVEQIYQALISLSAGNH